METLRQFYSLCRPPGLWGPVTAQFSQNEKQRIRRETWRDLIDCVLGIVFCASAILISISLFAGNWPVLLTAIAGFLLGGGLFVQRWKKRGVFSGL
ncbi:MAG: hypothetical protein Q9P14_07130 [candidate division KSB1 bacterium]|nr:hypothetical protein [candidate division KSB1 bacterium]